MLQGLVCISRETLNSKPFVVPFAYQTHDAKKEENIALCSSMPRSNLFSLLSNTRQQMALASERLSHWSCPVLLFEVPRGRMICTYTSWESTESAGRCSLMLIWGGGTDDLGSQLQQANENDPAHALLCVSSLSPCCLGLDGKPFPNCSSRLCLPPTMYTVSSRPYNEPVLGFCAAKVSGADTNGPLLVKCYSCTRETNFFFGCIVFCQELYILQPGDN